MRFAAGIEYDGSDFHGWQAQPHAGQTIQACVEQALARVADEPVAVVTAGRTDAGVHALAQVIHFDTTAERTPYNWLRGVNTHLPTGVALLWVQLVDEKFHARFSATGRRYCYIILNRSVRPTYLAKRVTWAYTPLDEKKMQRAAADLVGRHDFSAFRSSECQAKSPVREVKKLDIMRRGDWIVMEIYANAFLHHMVRNIAGVLMAIGANERPVNWAHDVLKSRERARGGVTAPPDGLYLTAVEYPGNHAFPQAASHPFCIA